MSTEHATSASPCRVVPRCLTPRRASTKLSLVKLPPWGLGGDDKMYGPWNETNSLSEVIEC